MTRPAVSIIIPHYNHPEIIQPCLASLAGLDCHSPSHEIVVVDDGSTDHSVGWIRSHNPEVQVVECASNRGFVGAIHAGISMSRGEVLVFLNNDTQVECGWLRALVDPILTGRVTGATGSVLLDWEGLHPQFLGATCNLLGFGFEEREDGVLKNREPVPVFAVCGGGMAISRRCWEESGGFDESYGMLYEDLDLGWRLNILGYGCWLVPDSIIRHRGHASLGRQSFAQKAKYYLGNSIRTVFKNADEKGFLEYLQMVVSLAEARERVCLLGGSAKAGWKQRLGDLFQKKPSTPLVEELVRNEEQSRSLATWRKKIQAGRKVSSADLFAQFIPNPKRPWYYDEEQRLLLDRAGYWEYEQAIYHRYKR